MQPVESPYIAEGLDDVAKLDSSHSPSVAQRYLGMCTRRTGRVADPEYDLKPAGRSYPVKGLPRLCWKAVRPPGDLWCVGAGL
jgi:hypothetical protein